MSDWKQIQARIRRAKASPESVAQLEKLFERTRDAMVAFELAKHLEVTGKSSDAARWYGTAAQRFRRADWKKKAEAAVARLSGKPATSVAADAAEAPPLMNYAEFAPVGTAGEIFSGQPPLFAEESVRPMTTREESHDAERQQPSSSTHAAAPPATVSARAAAESEGQRKRRHRGRRGGRNRRRSGREPQPASEASAAPTAAPAAAGVRSDAPDPVATLPPSRPVRAAPTATVPERIAAETAEATGPGLRGRSGDPGLSSRLAQLEMQLRRLLACPPVSVDHAERAPAGPGVFLVTDSDLISYYYVDACKTLRVGIANLLRAARGHSEDSLRARFAGHLGIPEARVAKYVNEHCVVRWLQLDENAAGFAHFAIAVLHPVLND